MRRAAAAFQLVLPVVAVLAFWLVLRLDGLVKFLARWLP